MLQSQMAVAKCVLQALATVYGIAPMPETLLDPLQQMRRDLMQSMQLQMAVKQCLQAYLPVRAIQVEMQVAAVLGWMEHDGMGETHRALLGCLACCSSLSMFLTAPGMCRR